MNATTFTKTVSLLIVGLGLAVNGYSQSWITKNLVAYFPFNGDANDASGNGNNATNTHATLSTDRFGNNNHCFSFNGIDDYIGFSKVPTSQTDNWSIVAWLKPLSTNQLGVAVSVGYDDGGGDTANGYALGIFDWVWGAGNQLSLICGGIWLYSSGFAFASTDQWCQVAMLRRSGITTFYVNGVATANSTTETPRVPTSFRIGSGSGIRFFNGLLDDIRIYNRALSASEVQQLYVIESGPRVNFVKAFTTDYASLTLGSNYQLQASSDMAAWSNWGSPFTATSANYTNTSYQRIDNWGKLFFRLQLVP